MWLCHNLQVFVQILGISLIKKSTWMYSLPFCPPSSHHSRPSHIQEHGKRVAQNVCLWIPIWCLMNNLVENNNIITCYWQDQFRTCNIGHESEDRFAFGCELDEMLSQVFPQACIPPQLSSLSLMPYFRLFSCTHLSHIPCEARIRTRTVHQRKRERDECE